MILENGLSNNKLKRKPKNVKKKQVGTDPPAHIDVTSKLTDRKNVQLVRLPVLQKYIEFDRTKDAKYEDGGKYLKRLENNIKKNGLSEPLVLAVSKETQRAYLTEGNHRIICLENLGVHWVPLKVGFWFLNDDKSSEYPFIPATLSTFPDEITPSLCGFETRDV